MLLGIPQSLRAGDTWKWFAGHLLHVPVDGWTITTALRGPSALDIIAADDGSYWASVVPAAITATILPGIYHWQARAEKDGEAYTIATGTLEVLPEIISQEAGYDGRTTAARQLAVCETAIEGLLSKQHASASFGDQSYSLMDIEKLFRIRDQLRLEVHHEGRGARGRKVLVQFSRL